MFRPISVRSTESLRKSLLAPGLRSLGWLLVATIGVLLLVLGTGLAVRPDLWRAGPGFLARAIGVGLGTSVGTLFPALAGVLAFSLGRRISSGWELIGMGKIHLWWGLWPLWTLCLLFGGVITFVAEPVSWSRVGDVRGVPLVSKVAWERLERGQVLTSGDGGWIQKTAKGGLEFRSGEGELEFQSDSLAPEFTTASWVLSGFEGNLAAGSKGQWSARRLRVGLRKESLERYHALPSSPWARSMRELAQLRTESDRADRVWYRRWLQLAAIPMLSLSLWCVALPRSPRHRGFLPPSVLALSGLFVFFLLLRLAEDLLSPVFVLFLPLAFLAGVIAWGIKR